MFARFVTTHVLRALEVLSSPAHLVTLAILEPLLPISQLVSVWRAIMRQEWLCARLALLLALPALPMRLIAHHARIPLQGIFTTELVYVQQAILIST